MTGPRLLSKVSLIFFYILFAFSLFFFLRLIDFAKLLFRRRLRMFCKESPLLSESMICPVGPLPNSLSSWGRWFLSPNCYHIDWPYFDYPKNYVKVFFTSVIWSSSTVFALLCWFSIFQQNCKQSFIIPSSILDTEPMSKKDCEIKADKYLQIISQI